MSINVTMTRHLHWARIVRDALLGVVLGLIAAAMVLAPSSTPAAAAPGCTSHLPITAVSPGNFEPCAALDPSQVIGR